MTGLEPLLGWGILGGTVWLVMKGVGALFHSKEEDDDSSYSSYDGASSYFSEQRQSAEEEMRGASNDYLNNVRDISGRY